MGFDLEHMKELVATHGKVARVVIAEVKGSSPREVGASMMVWDNGQSGTIGGGALELQASVEALRGDRLETHALGPSLGQCCGGAVTLLTEIYNAHRLEEISADVWARGPGDMPLPVRRLLTGARGEGICPEPTLIEGWMVEPIEKPERHIWIWGAGHVGRALVQVIAPLPGMAITWVDTSAERFPRTVAPNVTIVPATQPAELVKHAPPCAEHLVLTYSHALDLEICHALLSHKFGFAGLIGSNTKWARFRNRLGGLGHSETQISKLTCPIGQKSLGKHPQAIAVGVAAALLERATETIKVEDRVA